LPHVPVPDFRSPDTGLYANLERLNLSDPEDVFSISFFRQRPEPFYALAKELFPGKHSPTFSHVFLASLARRGLLRCLFTQNIDCLERAAGVPPHLVVAAHGSFASQRCIDCHEPFPDDEMRRHVEEGVVPRCKGSRLVRDDVLRPIAFRDDTPDEEIAGALLRGRGEAVAAMPCDGLVKPDIVFFGEQLPERFFNSAGLAGTADLVLVLGTSLKVYPFGQLPRTAKDGVPRVLFNNEQVGDLGRRSDDVLELGDCDAGVRKLAAELGWLEELEREWTDLVGEEEAERQRSSARKKQDVEEEVEKLTHDVEEVLKIVDEGNAVKQGAVIKTPDGSEEGGAGDRPQVATKAESSADSTGEAAPASTKEGPEQPEEVPVPQPENPAPAKAADSMD
jgi:NAD+-dependent protein deacetylase SIR2